MQPRGRWENFSYTPFTNVFRLNPYNNDRCYFVPELVGSIRSVDLDQSDLSQPLCGARTLCFKLAEDPQRLVVEVEVHAVNVPPHTCQQVRLGGTTSAGQRQ